MWAEGKNQTFQTCSTSWMPGAFFIAAQWKQNSFCPITSRAKHEEPITTSCVTPLMVKLSRQPMQDALLDESMMGPSFTTVHSCTGIWGCFILLSLWPRQKKWNQAHTTTVWMRALPEASGIHSQFHRNSCSIEQAGQLLQADLAAGCRRTIFIWWLSCLF